MAIEIKTIDEETTLLADEYDKLISPKTIFRDNNNKLYLVLRAYAAGKTGLNDVMLSLHQRFDPASCEEDDLVNVAKLVGTEKYTGKGSALRIKALNTNEDGDDVVIKAGTYHYVSISGETFSWTVSVDKTLSENEAVMFVAMSENKGEFAVSDNSSISVSADGSVEISDDVAWSCFDNSSYLGYEDESNWEFRQRILSSTDAQDHIKELENKIKNLPNIFECNIIYNQDVYSAEVDGITLEPHDMLIIITGEPSSDMAEYVLESGVFLTKKVDESKKIEVEASCYTGGKFPVYYTNHGYTNFSLDITYKYDTGYVSKDAAQESIEALFSGVKNAVRHIDTYSEQDAYTTLNSLDVAGVTILSLALKNASGDVVPYIEIPKTRLPHLSSISFEAVEV